MKLTVINIGNIVGDESMAHETAEQKYTKMREGEFSGEIPTRFDNKEGGLWGGDYKKHQDPAEAKDGD